jgi:hypothetical protein
MDLRADVKAESLTPAQKALIEEILGRKLSGGETVRVLAFESTEEVSPAQRKAAADKLLEFLERSPRPVPGVSEEECEAAIIEAMRTVRPGYTEIR